MVEKSFDIVWLVPLLPLVGFLVNGLAGRRLGDRLVGWIGSGVIGISFLVSGFMLLKYLGLGEEGAQFHRTLFTWIAAGDFRIEAAYQVDSLSLLMATMVTGVAFLIHVYSIGYMHGDKGFARFFAYLNLFTFMMLNLVLADNYLLMFLGWEGVGLCSYLLIGFWYEDNANADAGKKAFIVNRIGDAGFILGLLLLFDAVGSLNYSEVFSRLAGFESGDGVITAVTLLLFVGAIGKSAQIPLYVWLPDAMAGPTPVSALIHAATMVTAGVYMVARSSFLYVLAPYSMTVVAVIGAATALYAATIALTENDIKKVLAYSTISQLGYMFLAAGVGAFSAGIFHLLTHAFFKGLMFLCAGSVMHALANEQDMRRMGGLRRHAPKTFWTFLIGALAISGVPGLSGFFSKDEILWQAYSSSTGNVWLWLAAALAAGLTAFYMFRLIFLTFFGKARWQPGVEAHESPNVMTIPLIVLAVLAVGGGYIGIPAALGGANMIHGFLGANLAHMPTNAAALNTHSEEQMLMLISVLVAAAGIFSAYWFYLRKPALSDKVAEKSGPLYKLLLNKYYVDELYSGLFVEPMMEGAVNLWKRFDVLIVDGAVNGSGKVLMTAGRYLRRIQTGFVSSYALSIFIGVIVILGFFLFR